MKFVGNEFAPSTDANEITITARAPMGSTFEKSETIAKQIEDRLSGFPEVKSTTIKMLTGLIPITSGDAFICGKSVKYHFEEAMEKIIKKKTQQ